MEKCFEHIRARVRGPVYPVPPAFDFSGNFDCDSVAGYVKYLCTEGARSIMVTAGTSRMKLLTPEEAVMLNRVVAQAVGPNAIAIGAVPQFGTVDLAIDIVNQGIADGCDAVLLYYPERHYGDEAVLNYYTRIAYETNAPLMIHGVPLESGQGMGRIAYSMDLCSRLAKIENIVGMKEEFDNEALRYKLSVHFGSRIPLIVAGASMRKYLGSTLYGVRSWLTGVGSFIPSVEEKFFRYTENGDYAAALDLVVRVEEPLFDVAMPMGWHIAMRALLDIMGLMPGFERAPMPPASAEERRKLTALALTLGWPVVEGKNHD